MTTLVTQMTREELIEVIETAVERKFLELFNDSDAGLELKPEVKQRLLHQQEMVEQGERGYAFEDILQQLELG